MFSSWAGMVPGGVEGFLDRNGDPTILQQHAALTRI